MKTLMRALMIGAFVMPLMLVSKAYADNEYIKALDITVAEQDRGGVVILEIGKYSPFRRYSWFRVGDVLETVDGVKTSVYVLNSLQKNQDPHIKYRRGVNISAERQIGLEQPIYGPPSYVDEH